MKPNWRLFSGAEKKEKFFPELESATERILNNRNIKSEKQKDTFLNPDYDSDLADPFLMKDMDKAVSRILAARKNKEKVCVYGDFDADGVTASALLSDFFSQIKIDHFCYIPDKNKEGYGMNGGAIDYIKDQGTKVVVTVDCGISNAAEIEYAKKEKLDVIVIDHHSIPPKLPKTLAVINPKRKGDEYPEKELAGVGVAFKFISALSSKLNDFDNQQLKWFLDLVAIGTIADCVPLGGENRTLTKYGLMVLAKTKRVGLRQLFQVGGININENRLPTGRQIAFQIAPRINAAGRMDHASLALNLVLSKEQEESKARMQALEIEDKNKYRQKITREIYKEIEDRINQKSDIPNVIVEFSPHWEYGVVGLVSGKITDKYNRPSIILQEKDGLLRGSGRSIPEINLVETLRRHEKYLEKFGGHSQALGLAMKKENLEELRRKLEEDVAKFLEGEPIKEIEIDCEIKLAEASEKLMGELEKLEPFGQGNETPIFLSQGITVADKRLVGNGDKHLKLSIFDKEYSDQPMGAIAFGMGQYFDQIEVGQQIDIVYNLEKNHWNGKSSTEARIIDLDLARSD